MSAKLSCKDPLREAISTIFEANKGDGIFVAEKMSHPLIIAM